MPSITRRKTIGLLTGCVTLTAIGGAVAYTTQKNAPNLIVKNQTKRELDITTVIRTADDNEVLVDDTASIPAKHDDGYTNLASNEPMDVTIRTETGLENTYRWEETDPENALSVSVSTDEIGFVVAKPP
ncbi:hypothetical protein [Haloarcula argentinensis]|uniref:hypothetical protein n=1 Tax=Haloarcula argentinensis TaxID=43776 RepID=UPI0002B0C014|nr:hypothetical protein [Haloarcula argentinensis]EMA18989.1 hypothetical protein C443_17803 [Haloarcula argentinensis DSM 12282]